MRGVFLLSGVSSRFPFGRMGAACVAPFQACGEEDQEIQAWVCGCEVHRGTVTLESAVPA